MSSTTSNSSSNNASLRPIIVITGANAGVGFGICQRLIVQLASPTPSDTLPFHPKRNPSPGPASPSPFSAPNGFTLVLACRNPIKAHRARRQLQALVDWIGNLPDHVDIPSGPPENWAHGLSSDFSPRNQRVSSQANEQDIKLTSLHEDEDPALVAYAHEESSVRRRRRRAKTAVSENQSSSNPEAGDVYCSSDSDQGQESQAAEDEAVDLDASIEQREKKARAKYRRRFCQGTRIEFVPLDLGSMASALECAKTIRERYPYVTHIVLNAGSSAWTGLNWFHATYMIMTSFRHAVTWPAFKRQRVGDLSDDGLGWVWQCNVGAHWVLTRALLPSLRKTPYSVPSRIVWTSSLEAFSSYYDPTDFQCVDVKRTPHPYETTKYQCELAAFGLDESLQARRIRTQPGTPREEYSSSGLHSKSSSENSTASQSANATQTGPYLALPPPSRPSSIEKEPRSYLAHPGVVASSMMADFLNFWLDSAMKLAFYFARWFFSPHHPIDPFKGSISVSHVCLAPSTNLSTKLRYGSRADWWGREYVGSERIEEFRPELGGAGPGVGARLALKGEDAELKPYEETDPGFGKVEAMAKDFVKRIEKVSQQVWESAKQGDLPPWSSLSDDSQVKEVESGSESENGGLIDKEWEQVEEAV
ncbi:NAD(P)-binding protein [Violaceomyces palustris]|uniref:NAD(P)-binding protein n=1 Tax=Violaceomyces palustris TaxID=1673888 RepID=A0ACD0P001_9BASI|nr:NAD(P)-binding protein [Violaceomyces palustris]